MRCRRVAVVLALCALLGVQAGIAEARVTQAVQAVRDYRVTASDGVALLARLGGAGPLVDGELPPRPVIVEFSPYRPGCCTAYAGPEFNYLQVHIRGTGDSDGAFDALGDRTQRDVVEVLDWACQQPWSNGRLGLYGFSASAIAVYNSLHLELPCVQTAVLGAGTHELYRDLLYPGGIPNQLPALGVFALIGGQSLAAAPERIARDPLTGLATVEGMFDTGVAYLEHPTLDAWWRERGMRGDVNDLPILMVTGFYDVESRGPFQAFQELRGDGAHLMVVGAHDGVPAGSGGSDATRQRWYDRYLRDVDNGVDEEPAVQLWLSDGDREDMLAGRFVQAQGENWPLPGTEWLSLGLDPTRGGTAASINDGTLSVVPPAGEARQSYPVIPSLPTATDPHTTSLLGVFNGSPTLTDMTLVEPLGLSYTTRPFDSDVLSAGPASLELVLSSTAVETDIYAVLSDVAPDGSAHPVATGRLRSAYPDIDPERSLRDDLGRIVQPYGRYDVRRSAAAGEERRYLVELWPIGNRFRAGHRLRLHIVGASAFHTPSLPAINTVHVGGPDGSRLLLPVLPTGVGAAVGAAAAGTAVDTAAAGLATPTPAVSSRRLPATGGSGFPLVLAAVLVLAALGARRPAALGPMASPSRGSKGETL